MCVCVVGDLSLTSCDLHSFSHYFETGSLIEPGAHGIDPGICLHLLSQGKNCKCLPTVPRFLYVCWGSEPRSVWQAPFQLSNPPSTRTTSCILCFVSTKSTTQPTASKQQDTHQRAHPSVLCSVGQLSCAPHRASERCLGYYTVSCVEDSREMLLVQDHHSYSWAIWLPPLWWLGSGVSKQGESLHCPLGLALLSGTV